MEIVLEGRYMREKLNHVFHKLRYRSYVTYTMTDNGIVSKTICEEKREWLSWSTFVSVLLLFAFVCSVVAVLCAKSERMMYSGQAGTILTIWLQVLQLWLSQTK